MAEQYTVYVDDNFQYMDEDARTKYGVYKSLDEALQVCKAIVDACLTRAHEPGMSARQLYEEYVAAGDDPFIVGPTPASPPGRMPESVVRRCAAAA